MTQARRWRQLAGRFSMLDDRLRRLRRTDEIASLQQQLADARAHLEGSITDSTPTPPNTITVDDGVLPFLTWRPPGHYYSAIPDLRQIERDAHRIFERPDHFAGVDLNEDSQLKLFQMLSPLARDVAFNVDPLPDRRYFTNNPSYGPGDASITQALLRYLHPARYLEVGSGWTTALALDTNEQWLGNQMRITCIEPYPDDLRRLLRAHDDVEVIESPVQDVPLKMFADLDPGDVLFIDCSHVVRTGSDANHLITRVLPVIQAGVYVHIHDIFWGFEYPRPWIEEGRAWSEAYLLHAFLLFNEAFEVVLFNDWITERHGGLLAREVPAVASGAGGAIWLRRVC